MPRPRFAGSPIAPLQHRSRTGGHQTDPPSRFTYRPYVYVIREKSRRYRYLSAPLASPNSAVIKARACPGYGLIGCRATSCFPLRVASSQRHRGQTMHYVDEGSGEPVVFVHGNPAWSFEFRHLITGLRSEFRCVAPDHIGFGLSSRSDRKDDHHPAAHAEALATLFFFGRSGPTGHDAVLDGLGRTDRARLRPPEPGSCQGAGHRQHLVLAGESRPSLLVLQQDDGEPAGAVPHQASELLCQRRHA